MLTLMETGSVGNDGKWGELLFPVVVIRGGREDLQLPSPSLSSLLSCKSNIFSHTTVFPPSDYNDNRPVSFEHCECEG